MEGAEGPVSLGANLRRKIIAAAEPILRHEIHLTSAEGLSRAEKFVKEGGGLVLVYTHMSKREGGAVMIWIRSNPVFQEKRIVSPIAYHTYYRNPLSNISYKAGAKLMGIEFHPLVTPQTMELAATNAVSGKEGLKRSQGFFDYLYSSVAALANGDIVPLAIQARGESEKLGKPTRALSSLMQVAKSRKIDNYGILFLGIEFPQSNQKNMKGFHLGEKIQFNFGDFFESSETLIASCGSTQVSGRSMRGIDTWAYEQLKPLMHPSYSST